MCPGLFALPVCVIDRLRSVTVAIARDLLYYFSQLLCYGNQSLNRYDFCLAALRFDILSLKYKK